MGQNDKMTNNSDSKKRRAPLDVDDESDTTAVCIEASLDLTGFPTSIFLVNICSFLPLEDIFHLRLVSRGMKNILHGDGQDDLWKMVLQRDFEFSEDDLKDENGPILTLNEHSSDSLCPISSNMVVPAESSFDAVKKWKRASRWYFNGFDLSDYTLLSNLMQAQLRTRGKINPAGIAMLCYRQPHIGAPHFLRAARIWQSLVRWCEVGSNANVKDGSPLASAEQQVRYMIAASLSRVGCRFTYATPADAFHFLTSSGALPVQALAAFSRGQNIREFVETYGIRNGVFCGMMGGYEAYSYYRNNFLGFQVGVLRDQSIFDELEQISFSLVGHDRGGKGGIILNRESGSLCIKNVENYKPIRLQHHTDRKDELFLWLEEYVRRLTEGEIGVGIMGFRPNHPKGITLFPRYVPGTIPQTVNDVPIVSRQVTNGVEIIASAVFTPQVLEEFGFIYSIRVRLLTPDDGDEYVSPQGRGFETCQLMRRHWEIVNYVTDQTQIVDGESVIGMKPILYEGGYVDDGTDLQGTFQYQSCTGAMKQGKFGGYLTFEARSGNDGPLQFRAQVGYFALDSEPEFIF
ncbi:ApaG domain containing protein [Nitzschia inconspicua]|uniref:ApaG domain containing protein n=1 Tax=Nitzschia inconspicua TaxID=303405 RepID=A0A9K3P932_9STRA|nr:ApaG domain containing protein [Nitzschia inconspicua]KAG7362137.1 ApaG domain containing protein [Nitzschia inconspicua]